MNQPQHAAVFCVDEKTAIQALDRLDLMLAVVTGTNGTVLGISRHHSGQLKVDVAFAIELHAETAIDQVERSPLLFVP